MTAKPILYVANVGEDDLNGEVELVQQVRQHAQEVGAQVVCVCANSKRNLPNWMKKIELRCWSVWNTRYTRCTTSLSDLGAPKLFYRGKEVRAWTVAIGATAPRLPG